jgi:SAM-dependent methyltransferase
VKVCPVCDAPSPHPFLIRGPVPTTQNLIVDSVEKARRMRAGHLELHACSACGFVFNAAFESKLMEYGHSYENTQMYSHAFAKYVQRRVKRVTQSVREVGGSVLEIGCGKGSFLRAVVERHGACRGDGFDPSYTGPSIDLRGQLRFSARLYDARCRVPSARVIVCRHVIEHVPDPIALLRIVRQSLRSRRARVFVETPCVDWILRNRVTWDFFYEHCSYFSAASLRLAFERAGFEVDRITRGFGGQYLWAEAQPCQRGARPLARASGPDKKLATKTSQLASRFAETEQTRLRDFTEPLRDLKRRGLAIALWGAGAKGVTLANLIDRNRELFSCVVDLNPNKQGHYLPGSGHPIVAPADMKRFGVRVAVVTNPSYSREIDRLVGEAGLGVELLDLSAKEVA